MADRGQLVAAACPPRARLALTTQRAGWLEEERALLLSARALPLSPLLAFPLHSRSAPPTPSAPPSSLELAAAPQPPPFIPQLRHRLSDLVSALTEPAEL